jgi:hypothetical protein
MKEQEGDKTKDDPKAGADVGKIVNLMAGDANKVSVYLWVELWSLAFGIGLEFSEKEFSDS